MSYTAYLDPILVASPAATYLPRVPSLKRDGSPMFLLILTRIRDRPPQRDDARSMWRWSRGNTAAILTNEEGWTSAIVFRRSH